MRCITVVLPDALHEELQREAFRRRMNMGELIRARLERRTRSRTWPRWLEDPLLKVSGIGDDGKLAEGIDESLHGS